MISKGSGRALLIVLDGLGHNRHSGMAVAMAAWETLSDSTRAVLVMEAGAALKAHPSARLDPDTLARLSLFPVHAETLEPETPFGAAVDQIAALRAVASSHVGRKALDSASPLVRRAAAEARYVPWMAKAPNFKLYRNSHLSMPTSASGIWAGYEETIPAVSGNSETGHQQIANFTLAPQTSREITESIENGRFFQNAALLDAVRSGVAPGSTLNFCFLLSGTQGNDGRVHSAWNHLEAFLDLVFSRLKADPVRVRMQAILDGRDSAPHSSTQSSGGTGRYLQQLEALLSKYNAQESLCWVVGRSIAMDRDYQEHNTRSNHLLLTRGEGVHVFGFEGVQRAVAAAHKSGAGDTDVPPITVTDRAGKPRTIGSGEVFVNLNFRPDRQRAATAALLGARGFLSREAGLRGRSYSFDWLKPDLNLKISTFSEYHPDFEHKHGVSVVYPVRPHGDNILAMWPDIVPGAKYLLVAESVKSLHMGYFFRGRRASPVADGVETREIVPSYAEKDGVMSDSDFILHPHMRSPEIADFVSKQLALKEKRLVCCNLAAPDMIGHLLPMESDRSVEAKAKVTAAVKAYEAADAAAGTMVRAALANGYSVIITSDHGNIEDPGPAHSGNDVLTTVIAPAGVYAPYPRESFQARLFDISWTVARIIGAEDAVRGRLALRTGTAPAGPFTGAPVISAALPKKHPKGGGT